MLNKLTGIKILLIVLMLTSMFINNNVMAEIVSTSYKDINDTGYIYVGDISLTNIRYNENDKNNAHITGMIKNIGKNDASYIIKVVYYTLNSEIIASSSLNGFIENGEIYSFDIYTPYTDLKNGYTLKDIAKYKVSIEPALQGESESALVNGKDKDLRYYDFVIDNYKIDMVVNENNTFEMTEVLDVTFNTTKHGIFRDIPLSNEIVRADGTVSKNKAQVTDIYVSDKYTTTRSGSKLSIKIGDAAKYVSGQKQYVIKYTYNIGKDPLKDIDEIYYNLIGTEWDAPIRKVEFNISMPKDFDESKLGFTSGVYGETYNKYVNYSIEDNTIKGTYNNVLLPGEALTFRMELEEGYFKDAKLEVSVFVFIAGAVSILFVLIGYMLWRKHGKDDLVVETVEFYPPNKAGPLDIGYIYKGCTDSNDVVSLLIYLANKGYISIEETKTTSIFSSDSFAIRKIKDYDGTNDAEKIFMEGLFNRRLKYNGIGSIIRAAKSIKETEDVSKTDGQVVTASDLRYSFYTTIDRIKSMMNNKANKAKIFESVASGMGKWLVIMAVLLYIIITVPPVLMYSEMGAMALPFALLFPLIGETIFIVMAFTPGEKVVYVNGVPTTSKAVSVLFGGIFGVFFGGMPWCFMVLPCILVDTSWLIAYGIGIASIITLLILTKYMPKRTKYGNEMLGRIRGFRRFLETAEKEELEAMVSKDPKYFYDILPYAYVLGVSDEWIKQFESITMMPPNWYVGYGTFSMHSFGGFVNNTMRSASSAMVASPASSGGGSGGGFSGGGGGSSGGGSGGGGGGSW